MPVITIDGTEYDTDQLSDKAKPLLASIQACDNKIQQLQIELAMIQTARTAYGTELHGELSDTGSITISDPGNA
jgi:hypothetical protein